MSIVLPLSEWEIISNKFDANEPLNPLERFIYENLPAGEDEQLFYIQLKNALEYVVESAIKSPNTPMQAEKLAQIAATINGMADQWRDTLRKNDLVRLRDVARQLLHG